MSLLIRSHWSLLTLIIALLAGCNILTPKSEEFSQLEKLEPHLWNDYAGKLSMEKRIDLNLEIHRRMGHNPANDVSESIARDPQEAFEVIRERIHQGDDNISYFTLLFMIDDQPDFSICNMPNRDVVQTFLRNKSSANPTGFDRPAFYDC